MGEFKVECKLVERYQTVVGDGRGHMIACDLPPVKGGYDQGTSAVELAVLALADCILTIFAVKAMGAKVAIEKAYIKGKADMPEGAPTIKSFSGRLTVTSPADEATLQKLLDETLSMCPVGVLFREANCAINMTLRKK